VDPFSHEQPVLLVLPASERVEAVLPRMLAEPEIRHFALPPLWCLDKTGIDLAAALPDVKTVSLETLEEVLGTLIRLCDPQELDAIVQREWHSVDERVRQYYLDASIAKTFAMIFRFAPRSLEQAPPPNFRRDRIHENGFQIEYRLARAAAERDFRAPEEEGSITVYPFDPANEEARTEARLEPGSGAVLEIFPYEAGRARHAEIWSALAQRHGGRVVETRVSA
jgi:hypothetical protein